MLQILSYNGAALKMLYSYKITSFEFFKKKDVSVSIRNINVQILATDTFKFSYNILLYIIKNFFVPKAENSDNFKCTFHFQGRRFAKN